MKTISIVIPCRNEAPYIEECLRAIYACEIPKGFQKKVFVVDGMSDDKTREIVKQLQVEFGELKLVDNTKQLTPFAFNLGIYEGGKTDFVQIVGARHILSENYLVKSLSILEKKEVWCVGGKIINEYVNEKGRLISKAMSTTFGMGLGNFRTLDKSGFTDTVTSPMYPYFVFEKIGFFDEELVRNQDDDFNFRVIQAGGKIFYENSISLKYYVRGDFSKLWRQFFQYGYWKVYVNKKHQSVTTFRQLVPPLFVLYLITLFFLPLFWGGVLSKIAVLPFLFYWVLNLLFSAKKAEKITDFFQFLLIFPILHLSYGVGYLKGILHFLLLNKKPSDKQKRMSR